MRSLSTPPAFGLGLASACCAEARDGLGWCDEAGEVVGGLAAASCVDAGGVAHKRRGVMAQTFGDFRDAVSEVEEVGGEQVPDLVGAEGSDADGGGELVDPVAEVFRPQGLAVAAGEHVAGDEQQGAGAVVGPGWLLPHLTGRIL